MTQVENISNVQCLPGWISILVEINDNSYFYNTFFELSFLAVYKPVIASLTIGRFKIQYDDWK